MEADDLNLADLDALVAVLRGEGAEAIEVDVNPAALNLPGIWVAIRGVVPEFAGLTLQVRLFCVVGNLDPADVGPTFAQLYNTAKNRLRASALPDVVEAATVEAVMMPGYDQPLPALVIPLDLATTQEA